MCHCKKEYTGKFDLKNTVINIVAGLGLLSFITMFCDFILLNYVSERKIVRQRAYIGSQDKMKTICNLIMCCLIFLSAYFFTWRWNKRSSRWSTGIRCSTFSVVEATSCSLRLYHVHAHAHVHAHSYPGAHRPTLHYDCDKLAGTVWGKGWLLDWT